MVLRRKQCPKCLDSGRDNLVEFDNGSSYCYSCNTSFSTSDGSLSGSSELSKPMDFLSGQTVQIPHRKLTQATCEKYGYEVTKRDGDILEIANYVDGGEIQAQKIRNSKTKEFWCTGKISNVGFFGQHLFNGARRIVITEGEIDAMSVYQANSNYWGAVSVPNGAGSADKVVKAQYEWLDTFEEIYICFDNDPEGHKAAEKCAAILPFGKTKVVNLSRKDANEYIVSNDGANLIREIFNAKPYRPDGILHVSDIVVEEQDYEDIWDYPWSDMTMKLYGRRSGELVMHTSGSGMGKSTVIRELIYHDLEENEPVGCIMLEESPQDTVHDLMSLQLNKPIKRILAARNINEHRRTKGLSNLEFNVLDNLTKDEYAGAREWFNKTNLFIYDHFGSIESDLLINKMNYMHSVLGCKRIYLDHVSIVVSGKESSNERKDLDILMTNLRSFVERSGCHVDAVCHLSKPDGRPFEEGGQISLRDLRGSGALYQLADGVLGYERNQQDSDEYARNTIRVRSLKDRFGGTTQLVACLNFNQDVGRLKQIDWTLDDSGKIIYNPLSDRVESNVGPDLTEIVALERELLNDEPVTTV